LESEKSIYAMHASGTMQIPGHQSLARAKKALITLEESVAKICIFFVQEI